ASLFAPLSGLTKGILIPTIDLVFICVGLLIRLGLTMIFLLGGRLGLQCSEIHNLFWITHDAASRCLINLRRWYPLWPYDAHSVSVLGPEPLHRSRRSLPQRALRGVQHWRGSSRQPQSIHAWNTPPNSVGCCVCPPRRGRRRRECRERDADHGGVGRVERC